MGMRHHSTTAPHAIRAFIWMIGVMASVLLLVPTAAALAADVLDVAITPYTEYEERDESIQRITLPAASDGSYQLYKRTQIGLPELSIAYPRQRDVVEIAGSATPGSTVSIIVQPMNFALTSTVDDTGAWSVELAVDMLNTGIQNVLLVVNDHGVAYSAPIAQFRISAVQQLSNTTWLVIALVGCTMILLLLAVNVRFYMQRKKEDHALHAYLS